VADNPGNVLEDLGVVPDVPYRMTRADVLDGNRDLIDHAIGLLAERKPHPLTATVEPAGDRPPRVRVAARNITRIDAALETAAERRWFASRTIRRGEVVLDPREVLGARPAGPVTLEISGYADGRLVARRRMPLVP
jgi:hypothetical protein